MIRRLCVVALARGKLQPGKKIYHTFLNHTPAPPFYLRAPLLVDGPIIHQANINILPSTPASAHPPAQHYPFAPEFIAAVEAEESSFSRLAAFPRR